MLNIGVIGYAASAVAYLILLSLLVISARDSWQGKTLIAASLLTIIWSAFAGYVATTDYHDNAYFVGVELFKQGFWFLFVILLFTVAGFKGKTGRILLMAGYALLFLIIMFSFVIVATGVNGKELIGQLNFKNITLLKLMLSVMGLILIEQLYRNSRPEKRWAIKFVFLGIGGIFAYDFYLYSDAMLFGRIDPDIWKARGFVNTIVVPFIAVSVFRNKEWSTDLFFSKELIFRGVAVTGIGIYLLLMAAGGYYIQIYGGDWSGVAQLAFLFGAILVLFSLMFSGQLRARLRVYIGKHFHHYKYDYREEWLNVIRLFSTNQEKIELRENSTRVLSNVVESTGCGIWIIDEGGNYRLKASWNMDSYQLHTASKNCSIVQFLEQWQWVIDINEYKDDTDVYQNLKLPGWLENSEDPWLVVPLLLQTKLYGFAVLKHSRANIKIGWEERDLLITVGRQIASYLALMDVDEALAEARQFEAYNRLSAYVVHDLKNLVAQLSLVVSNAEKHKGNPEFMDDAISTIQNAMTKMERLLSQLRKGHVERIIEQRVNLKKLLEDVVEERQLNNPKPELIANENQVYIVADRDRMNAVLMNLVQNAQEATPDYGMVTIMLSSSENDAIIEIKDNGCGMDSAFIERRLFKPFDTTKGNAGMGIGVYESREFVKSLGGTIKVESEPEAGTSFILTLPMEIGQSLDNSEKTTI